MGHAGDMSVRAGSGGRPEVWPRGLAERVAWRRAQWQAAARTARCDSASVDSRNRSKHEAAGGCPTPTVDLGEWGSEWEG